MSELLKMEHLVKYYGNKTSLTKALNDISLTVEQGEFTAIMGASGSGKTTLLNCISTIDRPTGGKVWIDGVCTSELKKGELADFRRNRLGFIFQEFNLLDTLTAFDNIALALQIQKCPHDKIKEKIEAVAQKLGIREVLEKYPYQLSGGQKQRVAIARALATEPKVLLCDEATSALDPNTTAGVLSLLKDINTRLGITIVVITHEMSVIQEICDRVAIIDGGLIAEEGGVEEIFRAPKTKIGQELVMHEGTNREAYTGKLPYSYRLVFKGGSENEPVLGQMMIELKNVVNILAANTRTIENQAFGQMLVQFPEEKEIRQKMIQYLTDRGVEVEEVEYV